MASVPALVTAVCREPSTSGHQASRGAGESLELGNPGAGAPAVEAEQAVGDVVPDTSGSWPGPGEADSGHEQTGLKCPRRGETTPRSGPKTHSQSSVQTNRRHVLVNFTILAADDGRSAIKLAKFSSRNWYDRPVALRSPSRYPIREACTGVIRCAARVKHSAR